jgi:hypothetical protein
MLLFGQTDSTQKLNMDAVYNRPFLQNGAKAVALGGYLESHYEHVRGDGLSEGHSFNIPRMTLFVSSSISSRIKFLSEIELEAGGKEIAIEFAALDLRLGPMLYVRGGVIMNPIGAFNQNHDGPKWEFVDRPLMATQMLPATWSNVGFGLYGKYYKGPWALGYETYLSNGFDEQIVDNDLGRTSLVASKKNWERFEESSNGHPLFTGKIAVGHSDLGELGLSYMGQVYNQEIVEGLPISDKRRVKVFALDYRREVKKSGTTFILEYARVHVDPFPYQSEQFGTDQQGVYVDVIKKVYTIADGPFALSTINIALRAEHVDWNMSRFEGGGLFVRDHVDAIIPAISWRPSGETVFRINYRIQRQTEMLRNPSSAVNALQIGLSSYF